MIQEETLWEDGQLIRFHIGRDGTRKRVRELKISWAYSKEEVYGTDPYNPKGLKETGVIQNSKETGNTKTPPYGHEDPYIQYTHYKEFQEQAVLLGHTIYKNRWVDSGIIPGKEAEYRDCKYKANNAKIMARHNRYKNEHDLYLREDLLIQGLLVNLTETLISRRGYMSAERGLSYFQAYLNDSIKEKLRAHIPEMQNNFYGKRVNLKEFIKSKVTEEDMLKCVKAYEDDKGKRKAAYLMDLLKVKGEPT